MAESAPAAALGPAAPAREPTPSDAHAHDNAPTASEESEPRIATLSLSEPAPAADDGLVRAPPAVARASEAVTEPVDAQQPTLSPDLASTQYPVPPPEPAVEELPEREAGWPLKSIVWPPWPSETEPQRSVTIIMQNHNGPCVSTPPRCV